MTHRNSDTSLNTLKTSTLDRQLSLAKTSLTIGKNWAKSGLSGLFLSKEQKDAQKQAFMQEQADYLVSELGKLKGSVVKVGQMLALYGEHMLPPAVVSALHTLDDNTAPIAWHLIYDSLRAELGDKVHDFEIDRTPIGTASLAQVHKATHKFTGKQVVLKVQYPNVAGAIDADLAVFKKLLKVTGIIPQTKSLDDWFDEIRELLHREVDYRMEADTTKRFAKYLVDDERYVVPTIYDNYSTDRLICMSFEQGIALNDPQILALSQDRRDELGQSAIEIVMREIFDWGEMQTDPNFGNYLVRFDDSGKDKFVLLDFGAIKRFDDKLLTIAKNLLTAGHHQDKGDMKTAMTGYAFFDELTGKPKDDVADVFLLACEPFAKREFVPHELLDERNRYIWSKSDLYNRVMMTAKHGMTSRQFTLPPKEMMFISRKFIGAYAMLSAIDARTDSERVIGRYITKKD